MAAPFDRAMPSRPVGIDDNGVSCELQEERCVSDPCHSDLSIGWGGEHWAAGVAFGFAEDGGNEAVAQEADVPLGPTFLRDDAGVAAAMAVCFAMDGRFAQRDGGIQLP